MALVAGLFQFVRLVAWASQRSWRQHRSPDEKKHSGSTGLATVVSDAGVARRYGVTFDSAIAV
jgi:hypothetical protein